MASATPCRVTQYRGLTGQKEGVEKKVKLDEEDRTDVCDMITFFYTGC